MKGEENDKKRNQKVWTSFGKSLMWMRKSRDMSGGEENDKKKEQEGANIC